jgi:putative hydrolase of the HAD superfamily
MKVMLLDVDGVLVIPPQAFNTSLSTPNSPSNMLHFRARQQAARAFFGGPFLTASSGQADLRDILPPYLAALKYAGTPDQFMAEWFAHENHPNVPLLDEVQKLRGESWASYLATNQEAYRLKYLMVEMGLGELVDGEFASCSVGVRKPSPDYFAQVTAALTVQHPGLCPAEIVFWDDAAENVQAARVAGWTAHLYTGLAGFRAVMGGL